MILSGIEVRDAHLSQLKEETKKLSKEPVLAILQIGNRPDSSAYVEQKKKWGEEAGIKVLHEKFNEEVSEEEVKEKIKELNSNNFVSGIIIQLPLPDNFDSLDLINTIDPDKDVDGLTDENQKKLEEGDLSGFIPATAKGVLSLLEYYKIPIENKKIVVFGRSRLVGSPVANVMRAKGAEVEVCHSKTPNTKEIAKTADILISATGVPELVTGEYVKEGAVIIDIGINLISGESLNEEIPTKKFVGDVKYEEVKDVASAITPVPGGVGPMTVVSLLENVLEAYRL